MSYYLKKSVRVGPLRFNLSKSGIGVSVGIPGLRIGTGPRGNYIHAGKGGLYYRKTLSLPKAAKARKAYDRQFLRNGEPEATHGHMEAITSGSVSKMVDSSSEALLEEIEQKRKRIRLWPWVASGGFLLIVILNNSEVSQWLMSLFTVSIILAVIFAYYWDMLKKSVVMMYELEDDSESSFKNVFDAVSNLARSGAVWHVSSRSEVYDSKYHAGAANLISRKSIKVGQHDPPFIKTNLSIIRIPVGERILYFFPDQVLFYSSRGIGSLSYEDLKVEVSSTRFIETGRVPHDAKIVDQTWKYVNKSGGPDRRFKSNYQIPICEYEQIQLRSDSGLNEQLQASQQGVGDGLQLAFDFMASSLKASCIVSESAPSEVISTPSGIVTRTDRTTNTKNPKAKGTSKRPNAATPSMTEIYEALLGILCCVMASDGRVSGTEKNQIKALMKKVGSPWSPDKIEDQISMFITEVQTIGYKKVLGETMAKVSLFRDIGHQDILFKCIDRVSKSDRRVTNREKALCAKIRELAS